MKIGIGTTGRRVAARPTAAGLGSQGEHPLIPSVGAVNEGATAGIVIIRVATGGVSFTPSVPTSGKHVPHSVQV